MTLGYEVSYGKETVLVMTLEDETCNGSDTQGPLKSR